jgi:glutamate formiminotransferase / formiminotetrahydrofolate cyclodeaminase
VPHPLVECIPNFSNGRDPAVIQAITDAIESVAGVVLLDVDPGASTNRTVVTFVGTPDAVVDAAVAAGSAAAESIDMRTHSGEHPRFGAMDVCPFVPIRDITMAEVVDLAREAGRRLGDAGLTVYLYEEAASAPHRRNLADVRAGEYEGLADKLSDAAWQPDFGPSGLNERAGATAVGAREFLIAYNVNLNTTSTRRANAVAFDVRERGRVVREGDSLTGDVVTGADGEPQWKAGTLEAVKAIGWYIEEYRQAQVSMNLTNISVTPLHVAFDAVRASASARGMRVTGSELVGMVPLQAMLDAGRHYLTLQQRSHGISDAEIVHIAATSMGLDDLTPFVARDKIIEWRIADVASGLGSLSLIDFTRETASESPAPGGGSVAALAGALGAALGTMVANLSAHKRGWDDRWQEFSQSAVTGKELHTRLIALVDADTAAFGVLMEAYRMPTTNDAQVKERSEAIQAGIQGAIEVPLAVMEVSLEAMDVIAEMAEHGLESSVSDAGVGALMTRAAVRGAHLNVQINAGGLSDVAVRDGYLERAARIDALAAEREAVILELVQQRIG